MTTIAIIGAGMAGATAAQRLSRVGYDLQIFDKSRGTGGRLATRRTKDATFDHGAPRAQKGDDPRFDAAMRDLGASRDRASSGWRGTPGMSDLLKPWLEGIPREGGTRIVKIGDDRTVLAEDGRRFGPFDAVILAIPAPQAAALVSNIPRDAIGMTPVWSLFAGWDRAVSLPEGIRKPVWEIVPARSGEGIVAHMSAEWSSENLERDQDEIAEELLSMAARHMGTLERPVHVAAHRWRFARVARPLGRPFVDCAPGIVAGGDWALGPNAGHAWESGYAMADRIDALFRQGVDRDKAGRWSLPPKP